MQTEGVKRRRQAMQLRSYIDISLLAQIEVEQTNSVLTSPRLLQLPPVLLNEVLAFVSYLDLHRSHAMVCMGINEAVRETVTKRWLITPCDVLFDQHSVVLRDMLGRARIMPQSCCTTITPITSDNSPPSSPTHLPV
jgi:hypothetical protein